MEFLEAESKIDSLTNDKFCAVMMPNDEIHIVQKEMHFTIHLKTIIASCSIF